MLAAAGVTLLLPLAARPRAQAESVRFDARVELFSLLYHLADAPEYTGKYPAYAAAVSRHFAPFKEHAAVKVTRQAKEAGNGYFHPMNLAVHLTPPPSLEERTPLDKPGHGLGTRWPADRTRSYLEQVRAFYRDARVQEFFDAQRPLFDAARDRLDSLVKRENDPAWFATFFGRVESPMFVVTPALLNGNAQYGAKFTSGAQVREAYAIMGIYKLDEAGAPRFDRVDAQNVVHEFAHTLTDEAVTAQMPELADAGPALFARVQPQMRQQGYGQWQTMVYESVVRAVVVRFIAAHEGAAAAQQEIDAQQKSGFVAIAKLSEVLDDYQQKRSQYKGFADVMPRVVGALCDAAR